MERIFLLFKTEELYFLLPLEDVKTIEAGRSAEVRQNDICDLAFFCGLRKQRTETDYLLAVAIERAAFRLSVDLVIGVRKIEKDLIKPLDAPIIWEKNSYLDNVAVLEELDPPIAYILDISKLHKKMLQQIEQFQEDTAK